MKFLAVDTSGSALCAAAVNGEREAVRARGDCAMQHSVLLMGEADAALKEAGAKRALVLPVSGAFHSPLMQPAKEELEAAIAVTEFHKPICPVYQNVDGLPHTEPEEIKANLIAQLTASVLWTKEVTNMVADGATSFTECGPGKALQGMIAKICKGNDAVSIHGVAN